MSRVLALFHRDGRPVERSVLRALVISSSHQLAVDGFSLFDRVGLVRDSVAAGSEPNGGAESIAFDGRLDNRSEIADALSLDVEQATAMTDAALALACHRRFGDAFVSRLNGDFALALWDDSTRHLLLARDLMGVRPLYFWASDTTCIAASEIKAILAHPAVDARPDDEGLADAVLGGNPNAVELTCFRGVRRILPGSTVVVGADGICEFRHRAFDPTRQIRCASRDEYAEVLRALFKQAVRRRLRPTSRAPAGVLVSGGLDSSAILCQGQLLLEEGAPVARTLGVSWVFPDGGPSDEKAALKDIEAQHPVAIHRLPFQSIRLLDEERWLWTTEFPRLRWDSEAVCLGALRELGCSTVLDGYFGDQMMSSNGPIFDFARGLRFRELWREFDALARSMLDSSPWMLLQEYMHYLLWDLAPERALRAVRSVRRVAGRDPRPRWYSRRFRDLAHERSQQQRRPRGPFAGKHAELCYRHFVPTHRLNMLEELNKLSAVHGLERAYPFMDRDLVEFLMAIPGHLVNCDGAYKGLFREAMRGVLPEAIRTRYWKADFTAVASDAAATGYPRFVSYFTRDCLSATMGYIDRDIFAAEFESFQPKLTGESIQPPSHVSAVVGLELWLRAFFGSQHHVEFAHA